jgi:hypothetical protein
MSKVIRLTSKTGLVKEVSFGAKVKLEGQFHGAKIELIDTKTGLKVAKAKVRIDGDDVVVSFVDNGQEQETRLEGSADGAVIADNSAKGASGDTAPPSENQKGNTPASEANSFFDSFPGGKIGLGVLGAGALGGLAVAFGGKGKDTTPPAAPTGLDLAVADDSGSNNADDVTNQTSALTITGQAEANARVELFDGTTSLGTTTANASGAFSLDVTLAAGARSITAKATDVAGNVGAASAVLAITVDGTPPAAPTALDLAAADDSGSNNADNVTNQTSALTITGQAEANARVELFDGTTSLGTTTANASGAFSLDVTLAAGARSITAKATDVAGNVGAASAVLAITVDGTPPAAPTALDLAAADDSGSNNADNVTNQTSALTITGQAEANARVELFDGTTSLGTTTANASGVFSLDVTLAAGARSITAKATDVAGNVGAASAVLAITVDGTPPAAPTALDLAAADDSGSNNADNLTNQTSALTITGQAEANARVELFDGTTSLGTTTANASGAFSLDVTLAAGARSITAKATDVAGNVGAASAALPITVDSLAPVATLIAIDRASKTLTISFDQSLNLAGTLPNSAFSVTTSGGTPNAVTSIAANGNTLLLTLTDPIGSGTTAVTYNDPSAADDAVALQDAAGNDTATFSLSLGVVADGYIRGAQIFVETVSNGQVTLTDTGVVTDAQGNFFIPAQYAGLTLVAVGGVNIDTGIVNTTNYRAPAGSTVINPLTTVIQAVIDASTTSISAAAASQIVADALGLVLPSGTSLTSFDPIASGNVEVQRAAAQIAAIVAIADINASGDEAKVFTNIASQVALASSSSGSVDLASTQLVSAALSGTATGANASLVADIQSAVTTINTAVSIAAISQAQSDAIDATAPGVPTQIDLIAADDTGTSNTDNITSKNSFTGMVSFNTKATDGTAVVAGDIVQVIVGGQVFASRVLTEADVVAGQASISFVNVTDGTYSGSTQIVDKAGNVSPQSAALTFTVDSTAPSAVLRISDTLLAVGESAQVSIQFTEAVIGFSNDDVVAENGSLSLFSSSDGGVTWTATFTPDVNVEDASNLIRLANSYTDLAGNVGSAADSSNFVIDTLPNRTPTVSAIVPDQASNEDTAWSYQVPAGTFSDADADTLSYTATLSTGAVLPSWLSFNAATRTFSGTPPQDFAGNVSLMVTASDGSASVTDTFVLTVSAVEDEATGSVSVSGTVAEGGTVTASVSATDIDGSITNTAYQWQVSSNGTTGWTDLSGATAASYAIASDQSQVGKHLRVVATTTDALGGTTTFTSATTSAVANVNDAPVVANAISTLASNEDTAWSYQVAAGAFSDADGDTLTYVATLGDGGALPSWLSFDAATRTFSGTPPLNFAGTLNLKVAASDGIANVSDTFVLTVTAVNDAPVVSAPIADQVSAENVAWSYQVASGAFSDVDSSALSYSATLGDGAALPSWLSFNAGTRTFSGTPPQNFAGTLNLKVTASDGSLSAFDTFTLSVEAAPVTVVNGQTYQARAGTVDIFVIDASQSISATIVGFEKGDILRYLNNGENGVGGVDNPELNDGVAALLVGNSTVSLTNLSSDLFGDEASFEAIYGMNAITYVL